jgi:hypothetical protein
MWLTFRDDAPVIRWSQAAFERNWLLLVALFVVNVVGLFVARKLLTRGAVG